MAAARPLVLAIAAPLSRDDVPALCERARAALVATGAPLVIYDVAALDPVDITSVEAVARLTLLARRLGRSVEVRNASLDLLGLVGLCGLRSVLLGAARTSGVEAGRQPEQREEPLRVEEEGYPRDLAV